MFHLIQLLICNADTKYVVVNGVVCDHFDDVSLYKHGMATHWVQLAVTDKGMLSAIFLSACRSLEGLQCGDAYIRSALVYKGYCIRSVNTAISREGKMVSDATIAKSLALASDAVGRPQCKRFATWLTSVITVRDGRHVYCETPH